MLPAVGGLLINRRLIFDADAICGGVGTGQFIAPFYLSDAHAVQAVSAVLLRRVGALEVFHANADGGAGLQIKAGLETNAAGTAIEHLGVIALCLIKI